MIPLLLATCNAHKTIEMAGLLGPDFKVMDLYSLADCRQLAETGTTFQENATIKALAASHLTSHVVIADDSGLEVEALEGAPGVYSSRYAGEDATDEQNVVKLLAEMKGIATGNRGARFRCVLVVAQHGRQLATFDGSVEGRVSDSPSGASGFGYDPVFIPENFRETFAELGAETKSRISHRRRAAAKLRFWLTRYAEDPARSQSS